MIKLLFILIIIAPIITSAQIFEKNDIVSREVVVSYPDSIVKINIINTPDNFKPLPDVYYHWFSSRQIHCNRGGCSGSLLHGSYEVFDKNKNLITQSSYKKGKRNGKLLKWNPDGTLILQQHWKNGKLTGCAYLYYPNGKIKQITKYRNGLKNGKQTEYSSNIPTVDPIVKVYKNGTEKKPFKLFNKENKNTDSIANKTIEKDIKNSKLKKEKEEKTQHKIFKKWRERKNNNIKNNPNPTQEQVKSRKEKKEERKLNKANKNENPATIEPDKEKKWKWFKKKS